MAFQGLFLDCWAKQSSSCSAVGSLTLSLEKGSRMCRSSDLHLLSPSEFSFLWPTFGGLALTEEK